MGKTKATQDWSPGAIVNVGGRPYRVTGRETDAPKGLAKAYLIETPDGLRQYRYLPFRGGLELINCELIRPRVRYSKDHPYQGPPRKRRTRTQRAAPAGPRRPPPAPAGPVHPLPEPVSPRSSLWGGLLAKVGLGRKPPSK
jgi:hypothetical protein